MSADGSRGGTPAPAGGRAARPGGASRSGDVELRLPAHVRHVALARLVVSAAARQAGMAADRLEDLKIAVSEATTNAIRAHERDGFAEDAVVLRFGARDDRAFEVTVVDTAPGFDADAGGDLHGTDWPAHVGALGVTIIRGLTDACDFVQDAGMVVNMRFAVGLESEA